jgi:hypothetical protein
MTFFPLFCFSLFFLSSTSLFYFSLLFLSSEVAFAPDIPKPHLALQTWKLDSYLKLSLQRFTFY